MRRQNARWLRRARCLPLQRRKVGVCLSSIEPICLASKDLHLAFAHRCARAQNARPVSEDREVSVQVLLPRRVCKRELPALGDRGLDAADGEPGELFRHDDL